MGREEEEPFMLLLLLLLLLAACGTPSLASWPSPGGLQQPLPFHRRSNNGILSVPYADQSLRPGETMPPPAAPLRVPRRPQPEGYRFVRTEVSTGGGAEQGQGQGIGMQVATSVSQMTSAGQTTYYALATPANTYGMMPGSGTGYNGPWVPPNAGQPPPPPSTGLGQGWVINPLPPWAQQERMRQAAQQQHQPGTVSDVLAGRKGSLQDLLGLSPPPGQPGQPGQAGPGQGQQQPGGGGSGSGGLGGGGLGGGLMTGLPAGVVMKPSLFLEESSSSSASAHAPPSYYYDHHHHSPQLFPGYTRVPSHWAGRDTVGRGVVHRSFGGYGHQLYGAAPTAAAATAGGRETCVCEGLVERCYC